MIRGAQPTERKARTGLFTPPTRSFSARSKISRERQRIFFVLVCGAVMNLLRGLSRLWLQSLFSSYSGFARRRAGVLRPYNLVICKLSRSQPAGYVLGVIGENDVGSGPLDACEDFEHCAAFVQPAICSGSFHHGVF